MRILLVEDDIHLKDSLSFQLKAVHIRWIPVMMEPTPEF